MTVSYCRLGQFLSRYRSGRLPKAFKILPNLVRWEEVMDLTRPDLWSAAAMYQATRLLISNMKPKSAQRCVHVIGGSLF